MILAALGIGALVQPRLKETLPMAGPCKAVKGFKGILRAL